MKLGDVPNIVLVASGKGGVGKTTVASDIARTATDYADGVGLIDADISTPNSPQVLGGEDVDISDQRLATGDALVPPEVEGIQLVSQGLVLPDDVPVLRGAEWRAEAVADYIQNVEWNDDTELVVIDSPPGSGEELQVIASAVPLTHAYVVSTPHPSAVRDAKKTHEFFKQAQVSHSLVTNMAYIPGQDLVNHVTQGVNFTNIDGIGEAKEGEIHSMLEDDPTDFPMFEWDPDTPLGIGAEHAVTLPYTPDFETRRETFEGEVEELLAGAEVEA